MIDPPEPDDDTPRQRAPLSWHAGDMPYSEEFGDFYYSRADGRAECRHVFLSGNRLPERFAGRQHFVIAELGFGTGLNFIETWSAWERAAAPGARLEFHSFELRLLDRQDMIRALAAWPDLGPRAERLTAGWPDQPEGDIRLDIESCKNSISLHIHAGLALTEVREAKFDADAWYLDGFSPARNPEMWSEELMQAVASRTCEGGTFATYSAAGWVRRNLQAAGFTVEKRPGHAGKRDMSIGILETGQPRSPEGPLAD
ncbi:tRNA (5-methylaminomethyl-2-thiouridine)(34)-methyltransferase MnmD [Hoeflea alexandrii]|uniref:tRNA (5-methylaminomethyl-2-thiouridine)(34)-methyltransferase MnmD n=1 Tax=Hoeflea alexandrii TaxID=288436 RepID=A0ABT1CUD4_9HYPH|nr:tRNA (5-methylaminomethyl-2-thiouridine)(34)-methyltransferase MnmD [Hoeflea alexandrii]MCO6409523.1 tRNA (5-methylaminomethyl-2-thiouridine)(34)-methyltransferase MnmD [Hoeflea alexandrii]MCY0152556.1 tRNA (5-methylaminomethyl-2-thiouridine)(34)-methyltransferase MnmD [Hoeflea alexandrii]